MVGARWARDCGAALAACSIDTTSLAVAAMVAAVRLAAATTSRSSSAGSIWPRSITPSSETSPRSDDASAAIGWRAADPHGGSRRTDCVPAAAARP